MMRISGLLVLFVLSSAAFGVDSPRDVPPLDPGILLVEGSGAVLGGAACASGLGFLLTRIYDPSQDVWKTFGGTVLGGSLGYPVFCGVGCWAAAKLVYQQGQLSGAVVGGLAATPVGLTVAWIGTLIERLPPGSIKSSPFYVVAALIPPTGAVLGYNLTRAKTETASARPGRFDPPAVSLRFGDERAGTAVDVRLLNARF
jgi:hypothetical protein